MKIFISGASGLVGGNCFRYFTAQGAEVLGTHFSFETDYTEHFDTLNPSEDMLKRIKAFAPDVVLHCGALTWVDYCENHPEESYEKTVTSTKTLQTLADSLNAKFVFISTDYIYDGTSGPYDESASPNPLSVYGKHKLEGEKITQQQTAHLILRITNVYGDEIRNKNFISRLVEDINNGVEKELTLPFDQYATPINALDVARALWLLLVDKKTGAYNLGSTDYVNRVQLAQKVLSHFPDNKLSIKPISTEELAPDATRPLNGGLLSHKFLAEYPEFEFSSVDQYL